MLSPEFIHKCFPFANHQNKLFQFKCHSLPLAPGKLFTTFWPRLNPHPPTPLILMRSHLNSKRQTDLWKLSFSESFYSLCPCPSVSQSLLSAFPFLDNAWLWLHTRISPLTSGHTECKWRCKRRQPHLTEFFNWVRKYLPISHLLQREYLHLHRYSTQIIHFFSLLISSN